MIKALTIKQPWASLIAHGLKTYEFRSFKTNYRGELYIHAGKGTDKDYFPLFEHFNLDYPSSRVVARVELVNCILIDDAFNQYLISLNSDVYGTKERTGYAWELNLLEVINSNKEIKGKLGLWNLEETAKL